MKPARPMLQRQLPLDPPGPAELPPQQQRELALTLAELLWTAAASKPQTPPAAVEGEDHEPEAHG